MSKNSNKSPKNTGPKRIHQIRINLLEGGGISVNGFPDDYEQAMNVMRAAEDACIQYFFKGIDEKRFDVKGRKVGAGIIMAKPNKLII